MNNISKSRFAGWLYLALVLLFIMGPILVTIVFSFNLDRFASLPWKGFTLQWYQRMFSNSDIMQSLLNSIVLGVCVSLMSVLLGFAGAYGLRHWKSRLKGLFLLVSISPLMIPWTLLGLALLIFFNRMGISKSLFTVWASHIVFTAPLALGIINSRMETIPKNMDNAAWDLGAGNIRTMIHVILPQTVPALISAALMTFTISFDEFIIAWFVCGFDKTLPVYIYTVIRSGVNPTINAIGTLVFMISISLIIVAQLFQHSKE
ncbi:MAG: ABC transporter permease [Clostridiaceae bacterium]|jgi:spermidine/putrescine transport system permease protein|nr:ABC transporter permease [Clostridiaceae bacterium]